MLSHHSLAAICEIQTCLSSSVDLVDVLRVIDAGTLGYPASNAEHESKVALACLAVDGSALSWRKCHCAEEALAEWWRSRRVECIPAPVVGICDA